MKNLYSFYWDCGRQGDLEGMFISSPEEIAAIVGKHLSFGECLGKHSDVYGTLEEDHIVLLSQDQDKVAWLEELCGSTVSGYCPFDAYEEENQDDYDWEDEDEDEDSEDEE